MAESLSFPWAEMEAEKGTGSSAGLGIGGRVGRLRPGIAAEETARGSSLRTCTKTSSRVSPQMRLDTRNL